MKLTSPLVAILALTIASAKTLLRQEIQPIGGIENEKLLNEELIKMLEIQPTGIDDKWKWSWMPKEGLLKMLDGWYSKYAQDLEKLRARAKQWKGPPGGTDDIEMSITYLRLRETQPSSVWECSPAEGWSSLFILQALEDNRKGHLYSFGLEPEGTVFRFINGTYPDLAKRWSYRQGKVQEFTGNYDFVSGKGGFKALSGWVEVPLPQYVFFDAEHTYQFGQMYATEVLSKLKGHVHVSMHDAYRDGWSFSNAAERKVLSEHPHMPMPEARGVIEALGDKICNGFTISKSYSKEFHESVKALFDSHVHSPLLHQTTLNPTFWFELDEAKRCPTN